VVYLSGLHPENTKLSPHLESRKAVGDALIDSGIEAVVLQAGVVIGSGSASFEMIRHLTDRLPVMTTPKWVHNSIQPIAVRDALYYLVAAATTPVPSSRTWDIGGPDVLEYGDMMRVYAQVAGLSRRRLIALPFLTPTIASLWIGAVTPIPPGLARPLIESLECDAVMRNLDIDTVIEPPPGGLTGYRDAVTLALNPSTQGPPPETSWASLRSEPAALLPSDPDWAGEVVYTDVRSATTGKAPGDVWNAAESAAANSRRWSVVAREPATLLRLRSTVRLPGQSWLDVMITPQVGGGSKYTQRTIFMPRGIVGHLYWFLLRPWHRVALSGLVRYVVGSSSQITRRTAGAVRAP
jgi:Protein of unknown function (DUF2867)